MTIKWSLCNCSDTYIFVTGRISVTVNGVGTAIAFKNRAAFLKYTTHINDVFADTAENLDITMPKYNLTEYSDNYLDTSGCLSLFVRDEKQPENNANVTTDKST